MNLSFTRLKRQLYRGHNPRWSHAPESGDGAERHGGRFNSKGTPALYTSLRPETAWLEGQQGFPFKAQPLTLCAYDVDCAHILDLTDPDTRVTARVTLSDLACDWEYEMNAGRIPASQQHAERLIKAECAAIIVPSFAYGATERDINVVFWKWSAKPPHQVRVIDDEDRLS